jgi:hypothetical protein
LVRKTDGTTNWIFGGKAGGSGAERHIGMSPMAVC